MDDGRSVYLIRDTGFVEVRDIETKVTGESDFSGGGGLGTGKGQL